MVKFLALTVLAFITFGFVRTAFLTFGPNQELFVKGFQQSAMPFGEYQGSVDWIKTSWIGKKILTTERGINLFRNRDGTVSDKYPFTMSLGKGSHDYETTVLKIDYNNSLNPWWVRPVLDELVQIAPGRYLGKMEYRIIPYFPFTVLYFELLQS